MKKLIMFSMAVFFLLLTAPVQANALSGNDPEGEVLAMPSEVGMMIGRLEEIKNMDVSILRNVEKRELRREVRGIERDLKQYNGGGVYISVGAAILIVLLLILLL